MKIGTRRGAFLVKGINNKNFLIYTLEKKIVGRGEIKLNDLGNNGGVM